MLDSGEAIPPKFDVYHVMAAYRVELPDGVAAMGPDLRCAVVRGAGRRSRVLTDLGTIRRVGGETHFFTATSRPAAAHGR